MEREGWRERGGCKEGGKKGGKRCRKWSVYLLSTKCRSLTILTADFVSHPQSDWSSVSFQTDK